MGHIAVTAGMSDHDFGKTRDTLAELPDIKFICLDVANGYQQKFIEKVEFYR